MSEVALPPSDVAAGVRLRILDTATWLALLVVVPGHSTTVLLRLERGDLGPPEVIHAVIFLGGALLLGLLWRAPQRVRAGWVLVYVMAVAAMGIAIYGPQVVDGVILLTSLVFGVVYFGWRGLAGTVAAIVAVVSLVAVGTLREWWAPPDLSLMNLAEAGNAVRMGVGVLIGAALVGVFVVHLMKALDGSAERLTDALERAAAERRARERTQRMLEQSRQLETVGQIAGGVAHDFNNALVVILGGAQFLARDSAADDRERRLAAVIEEAAQRASEISRQLLTFSRGGDTAVADVEVDHALQRMGRVLQRLLPEDVALTVDTASEAVVRIAPDQLDQMVFNLAIHAQEWMPAGGAITLRARSEGSTAVIEVRDDASAAPPEAVQQAFTSALSETSSEVVSDLGLALVHELATGAGGDLDLDPGDGRGAIFRLRLPIVERRPSSATRGFESAGLRVLVVEGSEEVRSIVCRTLRQAGYRVDEAADPIDALEALRLGGAYDLVCSEARFDRGSVLDLVDGLGAMRSEAPLLICSASPTDGALQDHVLSGRCGLLLKPFSADELLVMVSAQLREREGEGARE